MYGGDVSYLLKIDGENKKIKDANERWRKKGKIAIIPYEDEEMKNAICYVDDFGNINIHFYSFKSGEKVVHTCLCSDVVTHESGHAILFVLVPNFIKDENVLTSALHESFGDITTIFFNLENDSNRKVFMRETGGDLHQPSYLSNLAEPLAEDLNEEGLRKTMGYKLSENENRPHPISQIFTGIIYQTLAQACKEEYDRFYDKLLKAGDLRIINKELLLNTRSEIIKETSRKLRRLVLSSFIQVSEPATFTSVLKKMMEICLQHIDFRIFEKHLFEAFKESRIGSVWEKKILNSQENHCKSNICGTMFRSENKSFTKPKYQRTYQQAEQGSFSPRFQGYQNGFRNTNKFY